MSGSSATITLSGPGSATVDFSGDNLSISSNGSQLIGGSASVASIAATGTTSASTLSITPLGINALATLGPISTDGSFKAIIAPRANLVGDLSVAGTIGSIAFDNMNSGTITLGSAGAAVNLTLRNATDETLNSAQPIGGLAIGQWYSSTSTPTTITAPQIDSINASRQFSANLSIGSGGLKSVVTRNIPDGTWNVAGPVGRIYSGRDIQVNLTATTINSILAMNNLNNVVVNAADDIGSISAGSMMNSSIYAGVGPLPPGQRLPESATDFTGSAAIRSVNLRSRFKISSFSNSSIAAPTLGQMSLGVTVFTNLGQTQGLAADTIGSLSGSDQATKKIFSLLHPTTLAKLTQMGINVGDFELEII